MMASEDIHNFSSSSPHRLPTVSAFQALNDLSSSSHSRISTKLKGLDDIFSDQKHDLDSGPSGGLLRGQLTEVYGPPGTGKTALGLQLAANALLAGNPVVWVDASYTLNGRQLQSFLTGIEDATSTQSLNLSARESVDVGKYLDRFHHFTVPNLSHLLAILKSSCDSFPPTGTSLMVVDGVSLLLQLAFPRNVERAKEQHSKTQSDVSQWAASRRAVVTSSFISDLEKLALSKNIAILLISQTTTKVRDEERAILHPQITGNAWERGISNRIVLFRDWISRQTEVSNQGIFDSKAHLAGVVKANGVPFDGVGKVVTFAIAQDGLREITGDKTASVSDISPVFPAAPLKRKHEEVADSQSEDENAMSDREFGWDGDQAALEDEGLLG